MIYRKLIFILLIQILLFRNSYCQTYSIDGDTIKTEIIVCKNEGISKNYSSFKGIYFSNFYSKIDSIPLRLNNDSILDYLLILSPISQEFGLDTLQCDLEKGKRLFVVIISNKNKYFIDFINENLIPNVYEYQSDPFNKLQKLNNDIKLSLFTGSIIKCKYNYYIRSIKGVLYLIRTQYECYKTDLTKSEKRQFNYYPRSKLNLKTIDIRDYMPESKLE